jgi:hypothetical protein
MRPTIDLRREFARAELGDRRLNSRLETLVSALQDAPDRSFPSAMRTPAELEAAYRFFRNERVSMDALLAPHLDATVGRAEQAGTVLVLHDTTEFRFGGESERPGLGYLPNQGQGFKAHFALAITGDGERSPLGLAGVELVVRHDKVPKRTRELDYLARTLMPRESERWGALLNEVTKRMGALRPVHVMDREADDFELFTTMVGSKTRFVVRMNASRRRKGKAVAGTRSKSPFVDEIMRRAEFVADREVRLSPRAGRRGSGSERVNPPREGRIAALKITAATVDVAPPNRLRRELEPLRLNVVRVAERNPPTGEMPVEWTLLTTEPIASTEEVLAIVDIYRARWTIEEYFKALKTGCAIEKRQLESGDALAAALGVFAPMAVRMLSLRTAARANPNEPAVRLLGPDELAALRTLARSRLPRSPTVQDALLAIAALGGHIKQNGSPGWLVLARGFEKLDIAVQVLVAISDGKRRL